MKFFVCFLAMMLTALQVDLGAVSTAVQSDVVRLFPALVSTDWLTYTAIGVGVFGIVLATTHPTLLDFKSTLGPDDKVGVIIEILNEQNEILDDMVVIEGNLPTGHESIIRTGIPLPTWRKLYGGVQPSKSTKVKVTDSCGMAENYAEVDKALADLNGNTAAFQLSENLPILEGFNQEISDSLFYANEDTEPEAFTGIAPRFNSLTAENGQNILNGAGVGADNTSIYLVGWGPHSVFGFYPKGSRAGLAMTDKGQVTIESIDGAGGRMEAYRTHYRWDLGLTVSDWRYIVRIANIDISDLTKNAATGADLVDLMTQAIELIHSLTGVRPAFYCNRTIRSFLRRQMVNGKAANTITLDTVAGKKVMVFDGVPVRRCDSIVNNEALVA